MRQIAFVGPILFKARVISVSLFYISVYKHVTVYTFICICWAGLSFVVIVPIFRPHEQSYHPPSCNKCSPYITVVCYLFPKVCEVGDAEERIKDFVPSKMLRIHLHLNMVVVKSTRTDKWKI